MILVEYLPNLEVFGRREGNGEEHIDEDRGEKWVQKAAMMQGKNRIYLNEGVFSDEAVIKRLETE